MDKNDRTALRSKRRTKGIDLNCLPYVFKSGFCCIKLVNYFSRSCNEVSMCCTRDNQRNGLEAEAKAPMLLMLHPRYGLIPKSRYYKERQVDRKKRQAIRW